MEFGKMQEMFKMSTRTLANVGEALGIHNLDPDPGMIFVTGGTGVIGHRVALRLLNAGHKHVRLGTSHLDALEDMNQKGAEVADFCWDREDTYDKALKGVKSVLCTIPYTKDWCKHFPAFIEACKKNHVKHVIKISFYHANIQNDDFQKVPLVQQHGECDEKLIKMIKPDAEVTAVGAADVDVAIEFPPHPNMSYTILYASHYMSNPFSFQGRELRDSKLPSTLYGASQNHGVNYVSPNDVAEVAVRCLLEPRKHYDKEYTLTGPEALKGQQVAALLSKFLEKPVMYADQPSRVFKLSGELSGEPHWRIADLVALEEIKATGKEEDHSFISQDVEKILGRKAESFAQYLQMTDVMTKVEAGDQQQQQQQEEAAAPQDKPLQPAISAS